MRSLAIAAVLLATITSGCAVSVQPVNGPDGRQAYVMKCSGYGRDRASCLQTAGEICPRGYSVVDDSSESRGAIAVGNLLVAANRNYITISCKQA